MLKVAPLCQLSALSAIPIRATRDNVLDLLVVQSDNRLTILTHGVRELPLELQQETLPYADVSGLLQGPLMFHKTMVSVQDTIHSSFTVIFDDGSTSRSSVNLVPQDKLTCQSLQVLALALPAENFFCLHHAFLETWSLRGLRTTDDIEFDSFTVALFKTFDLENPPASPSVDRVWPALSRTSTHYRFDEDPALKGLHRPPQMEPSTTSRSTRLPHKLLAPILYALHTLGEDIRLMVHRHESLLKLAPIICRIAIVIRPEWADYWKRLCPNALPVWPSPTTASE
jgi:anaphase-promoting complex subunit 1